MDVQFTVVTVVIVLVLFGAATVYAQKIDKYLDKKFALKQKAIRETVKKTAAKPEGKSKSNHKANLMK